MHNAKFVGLAWLEASYWASQAPLHCYNSPSVSNLLHIYLYEDLLKQVPAQEQHRLTHRSGGEKYAIFSLAREISYCCIKGFHKYLGRDPNPYTGLAPVEGFGTLTKYF